MMLARQPQELLIESEKSAVSLKLEEVWEYRDPLVLNRVKRSFADVI